VLGALVALLSIQSGAFAQNFTASFADVLTLYDVGEYDAVARGLRTSIDGDHDRTIKLLTREAEAWIALNGPSEMPRRRMVAATFALELGLAGVDTQWEFSRQAVEWACGVLRRAGKPTEAERQWHLAALALLEATFQPSSVILLRPEAGSLAPHIRHVSDRFPGEPRLALARALPDEHEYWKQRIEIVNGVLAVNESVASVAIPSLERAAQHPDTRAEARLRLGHLEYRRGNFAPALAHLAAAAEGDDDPTRTYLAHLFTGWVHEKAGRPDEAIASFRQALAAVNGLAAARGLGVRLYEQDNRDEADALVKAALEPATAVPDPWKVYAYGDFRRFPQLLARLRARLQSQ
jgi:tetratricopeptide (TPR) repeat protein